MVKLEEAPRSDTGEEPEIQPTTGDERLQRDVDNTTTAGLLVQEELKRQTTNNSAISFLSNEIISLYQRLFVHLHTGEKCQENNYDRLPTLAKVADARARFKAWAIPIAALQNGRLPSSLDYRLKDASEIRQRILKILKDLRESILSATFIVFGERMNETWGALSDSEDEEGNASTIEPTHETSELDELLNAMKTANISLMKLSMVIRSSPARDDYLKAATRYSNLPSSWDIQHVQEKHGSAKRSRPWLVERFGKAITRRRQYLKYREEHHGKLSRDWDTEVKDKEESKAALTEAHTKATTYVQDELILERADSDTANSFESQTSYEATVAGENTESKLQVPPHPQMAFEGVPFEFGEPFQCPYCYTEQKVKNRAAWKKHVFRDLKPYVCTFKECSLKMFRSRNEWFAHELQVHRREWTCQNCQHPPFNSAADFKTHLKSTHHSTVSESELNAIVLQSEEPVDKIYGNACRFCDDWEANLNSSKNGASRAFLNNDKEIEPYGTIGQFRRHLGRHMEQLALFALPRTDGDEMEDDSIGEDDGYASNDSKFADQDLQNLDINPRPEELVELEKQTFLFNTLLGEGRHKEAVVRARQIMENLGRVLGREHPNTFKAISNIAAALSAAGENDEAETLYRRAASGLMKVVGLEDQRTRTAMSDFADLLIFRGKMGEAQELWDEMGLGNILDQNDGQSNSIRMPDRDTWSSISGQAVSDVEQSTKIPRPNTPVPCRVCEIEGNKEKLLICSNCDDAYHIYCLDPPITQKVDHGWHCPRCLVGAGSSSTGHDKDAIAINSPLAIPPISSTQYNTQPKTDTLEDLESFLKGEVLELSTKLAAEEAESMGKESQAKKDERENLIKRLIVLKETLGNLGSPGNPQKIESSTSTSSFDELMRELRKDMEAIKKKTQVSASSPVTIENPKQVSDFNVNASDTPNSAAISPGSPGPRFGPKPNHQPSQGDGVLVSYPDDESSDDSVAGLPHRQRPVWYT